VSQTYGIDKYDTEANFSRPVNLQNVSLSFESPLFRGIVILHDGLQENAFRKTQEQ
jgi:hypothetical protein